MQPLKNKFVDGENIAISCDFAYAVTGDHLVATIDEISKLHGPQVCILPISGGSAGGGVFQVESRKSGVIVGLHFTPTSRPRVSHREVKCITAISLDEIVIDADRGKVYAGAAITLDQLNQTLSRELGQQFKVLGADITSYTYAQTGATFMTGGMGPQRRYFSDSVDQIALYDGKILSAIGGEALCGYAGSYGWSGLVTAVRCDFYQLPESEVAFVLPIDSKPSNIARLLHHFSPYTWLDFKHRQVIASDGGSNLILGIEHITIRAMDPLFDNSSDTPITRRARKLARTCADAGTDGLVFINGYSNLPVDEFLYELVDGTEADGLTIAGMGLEHTEIFTDPEQMRAVREAVPAAARSQSPAGKYVFKGHTDANIELNREGLEHTARKYWQINLDYVAAIQEYFDSTEGLTGEILVYGHLNPVGVDPHNRITCACDGHSLYMQTCDFLQGQHDLYLRSIHKLCQDSGSSFIGGEKSAGSESEMFKAFGGPESAPRALFDKFQKQARVIRNAPEIFNWRALAPYR